MLIDDIAYSNRWRHIDPSLKVIFAFFCFLACFIAQDVFILLLITTIILLTTILSAKISIKKYLKVFLTPLAFLTLASPALLLSFNIDTLNHKISIFIDWNNINKTLLIITRSIACLSSLLLLALTTPITDIISFFKRIRLPDILLDIMTISYTSIFILFDCADKIYKSQSIRLGYSNYKNSIKSFAYLIISVMSQSSHRFKDLAIASKTRNFNGNIRFLTNEYDNNIFIIMKFITLGIFLIILSLISSK